MNPKPGLWTGHWPNFKSRRLFCPFSLSPLLHLWLFFTQHFPFSRLFLNVFLFHPLNSSWSHPPRPPSLATDNISSSQISLIKIQKMVCRTCSKVSLKKKKSHVGLWLDFVVLVHCSCSLADTLVLDLSLFSFFQLPLNFPSKYSVYTLFT